MKMLKNNWKLKILSLVGAIFLWSFVISEENPKVNTTMNNVPIIYENENSLNSRGLVLLDSTRPTTSLVITGQRNQIMNITPQHIRVSTDLSEYEEGTHVLKLKYDLPSGIELVESPAPKSIDIQAVITKDFHVDVDLQGVIQEGYILESTKTTPEIISVRGPRSSVESISTIKAALNTSSLQQDIVSNVNIEPLDSNGNVVEGITLGQNFVNINAAVNKSKEVPLVVETTNTLPDDMRLLGITTTPANFFIKGDEGAVDIINDIKSVKIDLSKITKTQVVDLEVNLPTGISLVNDDIKFEARVDVEKKVEKTFTLPSSVIELKGLEEGVKYTYDRENFNVVIKGFLEDVEKVTPADFKVSYDATRLAAPAATIKPNVELSNNFEVVSIENIRLTLE
ncbi:MAG: hypothetical protein GXY87_03945 [Tissierellia bacterium]|nr:hypothetical protein [Tissierellia bacterium]